MSIEGLKRKERKRRMKNKNAEDWKNSERGKRVKKKLRGKLKREVETTLKWTEGDEKRKRDADD